METLQLNLYDAIRQEFIIPDNALDLSITNAEVRRIRNKNIVNSFLNRYHYMHTGDSYKELPVITRAYGLYLNGQLSALVCYNPPNSKSVAEYLYGRNYENAEYRLGTLSMSRLVACDDIPFNSASYLISQSLKLLWDDNKERKKDNKAIYRTVVSFAETLFHTGATYRAANAWFAGVSRGGSLGGYFNPETGDFINVRQGKVTLTRKDAPSGNWIPFKASDKLRYLFFFGPKNIQLESMRRLNEQVKFLCKVDEFSVLKEGRLVKLSDRKSYDYIYQTVGGRFTNRTDMRYTDYLQLQTRIKSLLYTA